jgi:hypothetical protein
MDGVKRHWEGILRMQQVKERGRRQAWKKAPYMPHSPIRRCEESLVPQNSPKAPGIGTQ